MKNLYKALGAGLLTVFMGHAAMAQDDIQELSKLSKEQALSRYSQWLEFAGGACCHAPDANIGLRQRETGDPNFPLEVEFTRTVDGLSKLSHPVWVKFAKAKVKEAEGKEVDRKCAILKQSDPEKGTTCNHPPGGFAFGYDNVVRRADGTTIINGHPERPYMKDEVIDADKWALITPYCLYPQKALN